MYNVQCFLVIVNSWIGISLYFAHWHTLDKKRGTKYNHLAHYTKNIKNL